MHTTAEAESRHAADLLARVFTCLEARGTDRQTAQRFVLQVLCTALAGRVGLLARDALARLLARDTSPADARTLAGSLVAALAEAGVTRGMLARPAPVTLAGDERASLVRASSLDWSRVRLEILGTLLEQSLERGERHALGAHFTRVDDIMKVVRPTIVAPWMDAIASARSLARLRELQAHLRAFRVLDPACGAGNFLSVAFRELRAIERHLDHKITARTEPGRAPLPTDPGQVGVHQLFGMDSNRFAVALCKVTLLFAHAQAAGVPDRIGAARALAHLDDNIVVADALLDATGAPTPWPPADAVIGNPPFLGAKRIKPARGADHVKKLRRAYPDISGLADYCVYFFRRTHDHLRPPDSERPFTGRAGLVGTQNIRNNRSRASGLDHVARTGTIVDAVANQPWSGDADVHVSIVNWVKSQDPALVPPSRTLWRVHDGALIAREVAQLHSSLSDQIDVSARVPLTCNRHPKRCFQGKIPGYAGFLLTEKERDSLSACAPVIRPYLTGRELVGDFRVRRFCIDFRDLDLPAARAYREAFSHCRQHVQPMVAQNFARAEQTGSDMAAARRSHLDRWWQFWNRRDELTRTLAGMHRYIGCSRVSRWPIMAFVASAVVPSDLVQVFAFDDDYSFGILQSRYHFAWLGTSSRLKFERDVRYSVRAVFETFPWPQGATPPAVRAVAEAARALRALRRQLMDGAAGGLRKLYRSQDQPGDGRLRAAHDHLDEQVRRAYGFARRRPALAALLELNGQIALALERGELVERPGLPACMRGSDGLVSSDCLAP